MIDDFPSTNDPKVAAIYAALRITAEGTQMNEYGEFMTRFLKAYQAIMTMVRVVDPGKLDVDEIMKKAK